MCNCNSQNKSNNYFNKTAKVIKKVWESTKSEEKSVTVTKINKS